MQSFFQLFAIASFADKDAFFVEVMIIFHCILLVICCVWWKYWIVLDFINLFKLECQTLIDYGETPNDCDDLNWTRYKAQKVFSISINQGFDPWLVKKIGFLLEIEFYRIFIFLYNINLSYFILAHKFNVFINSNNTMKFFVDWSQQWLITIALNRFNLKILFAKKSICCGQNILFIAILQGTICNSQSSR